MISHILQNVIIFFSLVGIWHFILLILSNTQNKETFKIDVKSELAGILLLLAVFLFFSFSGEI